MNAGDFFRLNAGTVFLNLTAITIPTNLYCAAFTDSVDATGAGTEVADPASNPLSYVRQVLPATAWTINANGVHSLTNDLVFPQAVGGAWGTIVSVAFVTNATGAMTGNVMAFDDLDTSKTVDQFDTFRLGSGANWVLTIS